MLEKQQITLHKRLLHGDGKTIFQVYPEKGATGNMRARTMYGTLKECGPALITAIRQGAAVGVVLNEFDGSVRKSEKLKRINAFFVDFDGGTSKEEITQLPIKPHIVTETSPGHYHAAWLVTGCPARAYRGVQTALARKLKGDPSVTDVTRCMRLAGTLNRKNGQRHLVKIVSFAAKNKRRPIPVKDFVCAFGIAPKKAVPRSQPPVAHNDDIAAARLALHKIPADERHVWLHVGMALHSYLSGEQGKALWDEWAQKARDKYDQPTQDRTWRNFKSSGGVTKGTLFYYANLYSPGSAPVDIPITEGALAKLYVATNQGEVAFDHHSGDWWVFEGIWQKSQHLALRRCKDMVDSLMETAKMHDKEKQGGLLPAVQRHATASALSAILRQASLDASTEISTSRFDSNPDLLGVENGVIELLTGLHRPARASDFITLRCGAAYDPETKCPEFAKFIASITEGDTKFANYIQRALGYSAFGHTREQVFFLIIGPGGNGKGVLLRAVTKALGDYGRTVAPNLLQRAYASNPNSPSPAVMALKGSRLYACTEFDGQKRFDEAFVKQLSGSDVLTGRSNFGEQETFTPAGKLWLSLNSDPEIAYDNEAMWRRVRVIPLMRRFNGKDCDQDLDAKLAGELPGIVKWLIDGARQYHEHKLGNCEKVARATEKLRNRSDTVRTWFAACCSVNDRGPIQSASDVYRSYTTQTRNNGRTPLTIANFNAKLAERGMRHVRRNSFNGWQGFVLKHA